ncbi:PRTRC system protein E [Humidesulfovibrio mexicanus]|uniref:PRTRC system protein E n=1 Tax=Humidesulfovibrio mexicanus TaxID=147047 RepID=A0A239C6L3_9BACT|nr:PRTRC system protein E [Humidesulfovibrio mexicanus]SNS15866.1 PRTRC system protein E [Humidesulfovibrio mexicanus]
MFKELFDLIPDKGSVRFALTRTGADTMAVVLVPEFPVGKGEEPKLTPLSVSGPVAELEAGFLDAVLAYAPDVAALASNLSQAKASMEGGKKGGKAKEPKPDPKPVAPQASFLTMDSDPAESARTCRKCGCTDDQACSGGCSWVEPDLCSACAETGGTATAAVETAQQEEEDHGA